MGEGQFFDIVLFAMIAGFLILRLRSVLGKRTGQERQRPDPFGPRSRKSGDANASQQRPEDKVIELPDHTSPKSADAAAPSSDDPLAAGLTQVRIADPAFDSATFLEGAKYAFETIIGAFAKGDAAALRPLLNNSVYADFAAAIDERKKAGHTLETTLVGVKSADVLEARVEGRVAFVTVKFVTEQVNVTRDSAGNVVEGDAARVLPVTDIWTFARNTRARDPNWTLVETRSPN